MAMAMLANNFYNIGKTKVFGILNLSGESIFSIKLKIQNSNQIEFELEITTTNVSFNHIFKICKTNEYIERIICKLNNINLFDLLNEFLIWNISKIYLNIPRKTLSCRLVDTNNLAIIPQNKTLPIQYLNEEFKVLFKGKHYDLVPNPDPFYCGKCLIYCPPFTGIVLQECLHLVCRKCLHFAIDKFTDFPSTNSADELISDLIPCVHEKCAAFITQREKRAILFEIEKKKPIPQEYDQLLQLTKLNLITNTETFECEICFIECFPNNGVILQNCLHQCCKECILAVINTSTDIIIKCPFSAGTMAAADADGQRRQQEPQQCIGTIEQYEIREIMNKEQFEQFMDKFSKLSLQLAGSISCYATIDCPGIWFQDNQDDIFFRCSICKQWNCINCKTNHQTLTCEQYKDILSGKYDLNDFHIEELLKNHLAMQCSHCGAIIMKSSGCDALICHFCKTILCWATKGPRWGIGGKNDKSGGCHCKENGIQCHPNCSNCH